MERAVEETLIKLLDTLFGPLDKKSLLLIIKKCYESVKTKWNLDNTIIPTIFLIKNFSIEKTEVFNTIFDDNANPRELTFFLNQTFEYYKTVGHFSADRGIDSFRTNTYDMVYSVIDYGDKEDETYAQKVFILFALIHYYCDKTNVAFLKMCDYMAKNQFDFSLLKTDVMYSIMTEIIQKYYVD